MYLSTPLPVHMPGTCPATSKLDSAVDSVQKHMLVSYLICDSICVFYPLALGTGGCCAMPCILFKNVSERALLSTNWGDIFAAELEKSPSSSP